MGRLYGDFGPNYVRKQLISVRSTALYSANYSSNWLFLSETFILFGLLLFLFVCLISLIFPLLVVLRLEIIYQIFLCMKEVRAME